MEHALRCNSLKCRRQLDDQAVVTTCSHIFCIACSDSLGLSNPHGSTRVCPACDTQLPNPDDAVVATLNPSEDYKTSVLSGLSPTMILECAGRAMSFYSYQTTQEIVYQEYLARSLTEKYSALSNQMDKIIENANSQISDMGSKMEAMQLEQKRLEDKNNTLLDAYKEKSKKQQQLQRQLKQQQMASGLELAADVDAENVLNHATALPHQDPGHRPGQAAYSRGGSGGSGGKRNPSNNVGAYPGPANRSTMHTSHSAPVPLTPSARRRQLTTYAAMPTIFGPTAHHDTGRHVTPHRQPLHNIDANIPGYVNSRSPRLGGMSAGIKVGKPPSLAYQGGYPGGRYGAPHFVR